MNSVFTNYAREIKKDGEPTGRMFLNRDDAHRLATEVQGSHVRHNANAAEGNNFEDIWNHFDINHDGLVEAERMPQFLRMMLGNSLDIDLQ